jgi:MarR family transcriptional regulator for hemolysin
VSELEDRFGAALHTTARGWRQALNKRCRYLGVSQAGWMTIAAVARAQLPLSQTDLADRLGVEGATIVTMVDRLVKAWLVVRERSATDRRINHVVITKSGSASLREGSNGGGHVPQRTAGKR